MRERGLVIRDMAGTERLAKCFVRRGRRSGRPARAAATGAAPEVRLNKVVQMPVQFRASGCGFSIAASIVLTILLNLALRACGT